MKSDTITLAKTVLDNLSQSIGIAAEDIPPKVIKDIFSQLSFLDTEDVDYYIDFMVKTKKDKAASGDLTPMGDGIPRDGERQPPKPEPDEEEDNSDAANSFEIKVSKKDDDEDKEDKVVTKKKKKNDDEKEESIADLRLARKKEKHIQEALSKITEDKIRVAYFSAKHSGHLTEGAMNGRHFMTNQLIDPQFKLILDALRSRKRN